MCAKGIQNAHFSKGQKLLHSPAHVEKHAGQETPLPDYTTLTNASTSLRRQGEHSSLALITCQAC